MYESQLAENENENENENKNESKTDDSNGNGNDNSRSDNAESNTENGNNDNNEETENDSKNGNDNTNSNNNNEQGGNENNSNSNNNDDKSSSSSSSKKNSPNKRKKSKYRGLTKEEFGELSELSKYHKKSPLLNDDNLEYMLSTGIIKISQAICDFDIGNYDTDDLLRYMHKIQPDRPHNYPYGAMREHVQKFLFYRLKQMVDFIFKIGLSYHKSFYEVYLISSFLVLGDIRCFGLLFILHFVLFCFLVLFFQVLKLIIYRQNKVFHAHYEHQNLNWVKYDASFIINWERESATSHVLRSVHPCYLWLANHFFEQKYFHTWYKEVNDNIRPQNYNDNNDDTNDNKENTNNNNNNTNNNNENNYSYAWFKMNCFMSVAFNCTRYAFSHYQTQIAKSALEVCYVLIMIQFKRNH